MLSRFKFKLIDLYMKTDVLSRFDECRESQWWRAKGLQERQLDPMQRLLIHAGNFSPYYRELFGSHQFDPKAFEGFEDLKRIPVQTKHSLRSEYDRVRTTDYLNYDPRVTKTSGSTGEPFTIVHSGLSHSYLRGLNFTAWAQAGYELGDEFATFAGGSLLPDTLGFKQRVYSYLQNNVPLPSYHLSPERFRRYVKVLRRRRTKYIYGYASALADFAKSIERDRLDFSFVQGVFSSSDMLSSQQRALIESVLGVRVVDIYGNPESGLISYECEKHNGFHYGMQNCYVEIVDEQGCPMPAGEQGRVVVTSLNNFCFPMIRYDTGDIAALSSEDCPCGRGLQLIKNLGGRSRDYIVLPDGRHIHGAFFNHLNSIYGAVWLDRYHVVQKSLDRLLFQCLVNRAPSTDELNRIRDEISAGVASLLRVEVSVVQSIPMTRMGKYKLITREFDENA